MDFFGAKLHGASPTIASRNPAHFPDLTDAEPCCGVSLNLASRLEAEFFGLGKINAEPEFAIDFETDVIPPGVFRGRGLACRNCFHEHVQEIGERANAVGHGMGNLCERHVSCPQKVEELVQYEFGEGIDSLPSTLLIEPLRNLEPANKAVCLGELLTVDRIARQKNQRCLRKSTCLKPGTVSIQLICVR